jgi:hypothetical protein
MEKLSNKKMDLLKGGTSQSSTSSGGYRIVYIDGVPHKITRSGELIPMR